MKNKQTILSIIALIAFLLLGWLFMNGVISLLKSLDKTVTAALITAFLGLTGLWYSQWHSKNRDIAESHRDSKIKVYSAFFDIVEKLQLNEISDEDLLEENLSKELRQEFTTLNRGLILWASPGVITAWLKFRTISDSGDQANLLITMDELYKAIRKDLGNSNFGLRSGDFIRIGLKDPTELK